MKQIDNYMTPAEAAYKWGLSPETVKSRLKPSLYEKQINELVEQGLIKFFQNPKGTRKEWIITNEAMEHWFGKKE